jgi:hypothetical protein
MGVLRLKILKLLLLGLFLASLSRCRSFEPLSLERKNFTGSNLKQNGYYYTIRDDTYNTFFLYKNGIYHGGAGVGKIESGNLVLENLDKNVREVGLIKEQYPSQYHWGVFNVSGSEIMIERWLSGSGGAYPTEILTGEIVNDTTIHFSGRIGRGGNSGGRKKAVYKIDETYHFRALDYKPDSTNRFIK